MRLLLLVLGLLQMRLQSSAVINTQTEVTSSTSACLAVLLEANCGALSRGGCGSAAIAHL